MSSKASLGARSLICSTLNEGSERMKGLPFWQWNMDLWSSMTFPEPPRSWRSPAMFDWRGKGWWDIYGYMTLYCEDSCDWMIDDGIKQKVSNRRLCNKSASQLQNSAETSPIFGIWLARICRIWDVPDVGASHKNTRGSQEAILKLGSCWFSFHLLWILDYLGNWRTAYDLTNYYTVAVFQNLCGRNAKK